MKMTTDKEIIGMTFTPEPVDPKLVRELRVAVKGVYDFQALRMMLGLRLCANFRAKLKVSSTSSTDIVIDEETTEKELSKAALDMLENLRSSYRRLTDGIARNRTLPDEKGFTGDELINSYTELVLVHQYISMEKQETQAFSQLKYLLANIPIFRKYLSKTTGIGEAMAGVIIAYLDPHRAPYASSFWKFAGLDVVLVTNEAGEMHGEGRSRREHHLIDREYKTRAGTMATRRSVTFEPFLKAKLMGVLAGSFLRTNSPWRKVYDDYRNRLQSDPNRVKVTSVAWKKAYAAGVDVHNLWPPLRIHNAALRYMVKMFLQDLWEKWRMLEGCEQSKNPYYMDFLGKERHNPPYMEG
jgi:hypothetical protein